MPGLVWLQLIPLVGQVWQFFVVARISSSIRKGLTAEYENTVFGADAAVVQKGVANRPTLAMGLAYCIP
jgi:hypothetical protein